MINEDRSLENPNISYVALSSNSHSIQNIWKRWIVDQKLIEFCRNSVLEQLQIHLTNVDKVFASKFELNYMVNITVAVIWNSSRLS